MTFPLYFGLACWKDHETEFMTLVFIANLRSGASIIVIKVGWWVLILLSAELKIGTKFPTLSSACKTAHHLFDEMLNTVTYHFVAGFVLVCYRLRVEKNHRPLCLYVEEAKHINGCLWSLVFGCNKYWFRPATELSFIWDYQIFDSACFNSLLQ